MQWRPNTPGRWKWYWISFLCLIAAGASFAQGTLDNSVLQGIEIVKLKWQKEVRLPRNFDPSILPANGVLPDTAPRSAATTAPTIAPSGSVVSDQTRAATSARMEAAGSSIVFPATPGRLPIFYVYSLKIKNVGPRTIEGIAWDYLFIDPIGNKELGSHHFLSYEKISPAKIVTLKSQLRSPPTRVIQAPNVKSKQQPKFVERAVIQCVVYSDATIWRNAQVSEGVCDLLKNGKELLKRRHGAGASP